MKENKVDIYIVMKLGRIPGIDFYEEHNKVLVENGYCDFARVSKKKIAITSYDRKKVFVKESKSSQNRLIMMEVEDISRGEIYPEYYKWIDLTGATWMRIKKMEIIDITDFLSQYCRTNGEEILALDRGAIPFFFVKRKI